MLVSCTSTLSSVDTTLRKKEEKPSLRGTAPESSESGDILRDNVKKETELGKKAEFERLCPSFLESLLSAESHQAKGYMDSGAQGAPRVPECPRVGLESSPAFCLLRARFCTCRGWSLASSLWTWSRPMPNHLQGGAIGHRLTAAKDRLMQEDVKDAVLKGSEANRAKGLCWSPARRRAACWMAFLAPRIRQAGADDQAI